METFDKQMLEFQLKNNVSSRSNKRIPPAVPPKKVVSHSVPRPPQNIGNNHCQPLYISKHETAVPLVSTLNNNSISTNSEPYELTPVYKNCIETHDQNVSPLDDMVQYDTLPPPSPVSSNYSELAQATQNISYGLNNFNYQPIYSNEYPEYGLPSASNHDSFYETISTPVEFEPSNKTSDRNHLRESKVLPREQEVNALTNMLVKCMTNSQDLDTFGTCVKCGEKVVGENTGCTAMDNVYHLKCFLCHICKTSLQGKPFYAVDGEPYCEADYRQTLEKCSVCIRPILDRILRASGKPYHPSCFTCIVCNKSLDGIPFTVDAMNQIHCIEDFHKKFAPKCSVCELPIMPEEGEEETVRVVALDRSFHVDCYRCEDCNLLLTSESDGTACYPLDDHILCKTCNMSRIRMLTNVLTTDL